MVSAVASKAGFTSDDKRFNALLAGLLKEADDQEKRSLVRLLRKFLQSD
jgi:hypothetical protein